MYGVERKIKQLVFGCTMFTVYTVYFISFINSFSDKLFPNLKSIKEKKVNKH